MIEASPGYRLAQAMQIVCAAVPYEILDTARDLTTREAAFT
jgi:hypothetical protein